MPHLRKPATRLPPSGGAASSRAAVRQAPPISANVTALARKVASASFALGKQCVRERKIPARSMGRARVPTRRGGWGQPPSQSREAANRLQPGVKQSDPRPEPSLLFLEGDCLEVRLPAARRDAAPPRAPPPHPPPRRAAQSRSTMPRHSLPAKPFERRLLAASDTLAKFAAIPRTSATTLQVISGRIPSAPASR